MIEMKKLVFLFFHVSLFVPHIFGNMEKIYLYYSEDGYAMTHEQFSDSLATRRYVLNLAGSTSDTVRYTLHSVIPRDIVGKELPDVEWKTLAGDTFVYGETDKITVFSFWSVLGGELHIESFNEMNKRAVQYPDVQIIALFIDSASLVSAFIEKHGIEWENITIVPEYKGNFDEIFYIFSLPLAVVTNKQREVIKVFLNENEKLIEFINYFRHPDFSESNMVLDIRCVQ